MRRRTRIVLLAFVSALPALCAPGLVATYSDGAVTLRDVVPSPNFYLESGETLHPALQESFGAVFRGSLSVPQSGRYELFPGPAELEIDRRSVFGPLFLTSGEHEFQLRYSSARGEHGVRLEWQGPGFAREPVPARLFRHDDADAPRAVERLAETGRRLATDLGCANCHLASNTLAKRPGPPLDGIGSRTNPAWLKRWLDNPQAFRSTATMPRAAHRSDANDLAEYLMTLTGDALPDAPIHRAQTDDAGHFLFTNLGCTACHEKDGVPLLGLGSKTTAAHLQRYLLNPLVWEPSGRMPAFELDERAAAGLARHLSAGRKPDFERQPLGGDAERGRQRFENAGCVACHQLEGATNRLAAPDFANLDPERGCLSDKPAEPAPLYSLKPSQKDALRAFVAFYRSNPDRTRAPIHDFRARLEQLRCNACHEVDGKPAQAELHQQAPSLDGVGERMRISWLRRVLSQPTREYEPLEPQMPQYHPQDVGVLAEGFAKAAGLEPGDGAAPQQMSSARQNEGLALLGADPDRGGMGCVRCHGWGERENAPGSNLAQAFERLRYDWFLRWMLDPQQIRPGTAMPSFFAGQTAEEARTKLETLWAGLSAPVSAGPPPGFDRQERTGGAPPQSSGEAVIVRRAMPEAPDAILVGLSDGISYCFDPGESRLLYAWRGDVDAVADAFYRQTAFPIRLGDVDQVPEPRFITYEMVEGAPEFHYEVDGTDIYERILLRNGELVRQFRLPRADQPMWLVIEANEGARVTTSLGSGLARLQLPRGENIRFEVRVGAR